MNTVTIDPALKRLLDNLPAGNPDAIPEKAPPQEPDQCEVWITWCEGRHVVPLGKETRIEFGRWCGPPTPLDEVLVHIRNLKTGRLRTLAWTDLRAVGGVNRPYMATDCRLILEGIFDA